MKKLVFLICVISFYAASVSAQVTEKDSVTVTLKVVVPESTPDGATIFWAGSTNHWDPGNKGSGFGAKDYSKPLKIENGAFTLTLKAPKNSEISYKYTRGSIFSVEERADYTYQPVRKVTFDQQKMVYDTVRAWHDIPPEALQDKWPKVDLVKADINLSYNGIPMNGSGTILYDKTMISKFYDTRIRWMKFVPEILVNSVSYYVPVSSENFVLVLAGQLNESASWNVYVDQNNDRSIDSDELVFTIASDSIAKMWTGKVQYGQVNGNSVSTGTTKLTISHLTNLPKGYSSSAIENAPDLGYKLPFKNRKGTLNEHVFNITTGFGNSFSSFFRLTVDRNQNDTLEIGSGSNEITALDFSKMHMQKKYYLHPVFKLGDQFWEVVNIDPRGEWIRLRPAQKSVSRQPIVKGKPALQWEAVTVEGDTISSESLSGNYILLDFWGSWCGPCIEEIPLLKKVYRRFKSQNFKMIGFAYENQNSLDRALKKYQLPWLQILDDKSYYSSMFLVRGYPSHFLIGPEGNILEMGATLRGEKLIPTLEKYLGFE